MYSSHLRGGKAFAAEQKIRDRKLLLRRKHIEKFKGKHIKPNELIKKATFNLNNTRSVKYGHSPEQIEELALNPETEKYFQEVYDFHCLIKVKEERDRRERFDAKVDKHKKRLWDPLEIGKMTLLEDCINTTENKSFFNRGRTFAISERSKLNNNTYLYWLKENGEKQKIDF